MVCAGKVKEQPGVRRIINSLPQGPTQGLHLHKNSYCIFRERKKNPAAATVCVRGGGQEKISEKRERKGKI